MLLLSARLSSQCSHTFGIRSLWIWIWVCERVNVCLAAYLFTLMIGKKIELDVWQVMRCYKIICSITAAADNIVVYYCCCTTLHVYMKRDSLCYKLCLTNFICNANKEIRLTYPPCFPFCSLQCHCLVRHDLTEMGMVCTTIQGHGIHA